jgi:hypothetical protein
MKPVKAKNIIVGLLSLAIIAATAFCLKGQNVSAAGQPSRKYEYVAIRFMGGDKACVIWPDGRAERIGDLVPTKRPGLADERMFQLCIAINHLAKQGFEPAALPSVAPSPDDLWLRRQVGP